MTRRSPRYTDEQLRARSETMRARWADPEWRAARAENMKVAGYRRRLRNGHAANVEDQHDRVFRNEPPARGMGPWARKRSEAQRKAWADPESREKRVAALKGSHDTFDHSQEAHLGRASGGSAPLDTPLLELLSNEARAVLLDAMTPERLCVVVDERQAKVIRKVMSSVLGARHWHETSKAQALNEAIAGILLGVYDAYVFDVRGDDGLRFYQYLLSGSLALPQHVVDDKPPRAEAYAARTGV